MPLLLTSCLFGTILRSRLACLYKVSKGRTCPGKTPYSISTPCECHFASLSPNLIIYISVSMEPSWRPTPEQTLVKTQRRETRLQFLENRPVSPTDLASPLVSRVC